MSCHSAHTSCKIHGAPSDICQERFKGAHNATNYPRWVAAAETYSIDGSAISRCHYRAARSCAQVSDST
jgi:hypothetical protein